MVVETRRCCCYWRYTVRFHAYQLGDWDRSNAAANRSISRSPRLLLRQLLGSHRVRLLEERRQQSMLLSLGLRAETFPKHGHNGGWRRGRPKTKRERTGWRRGKQKANWWENKTNWMGNKKATGWS